MLVLGSQREFLGDDLMYVANVGKGCQPLWLEGSPHHRGATMCPLSQVPTYVVTDLHDRIWSHRIFKVTCYNLQPSRAC